MEYRINFNVICSRCGKHLKAEMNWRGNVIVEPCPNCMNDNPEEFNHNAIGEVGSSVADKMISERGNNG